ncbi:MAG: GntR family transcriptional regulator [Candidatus Spyradocola sp.]|jgi:GntR family transcriptional regulator
MLDYTLHKDIPVPLYYQLKLQILADIKEGRLRVGDMLPPECELCKKMGVSRPTVRQAMNELVTEGHLTRCKGKGTFVSEPSVRPVDARFFQGLQSFNEEMLQKGLLPSTRVLALEMVTDREDIATALRVTEDKRFLHLSRLRSANGQPLVVVDTWLPYGRFRGLMDEDFSVKSLYALMEQKYNVRVDRATRQFEAASVSPEDAALLGMDAGRAVCRVYTLAYAKNQPVEYSIARYRGDRNIFTVELYR